MQRKLLILLFLNITTYSAQNLVPNPSFEQNCICYDGMGGAVFNCSNWFAIEPILYTSSPDYFSSNCNQDRSTPKNTMGYQFPIQGNSYVGIQVFYGPYHWSSPNLYREYISIQLTSPLIKDSIFYCSYYVSAGDKINRYTIKNIDALISHTVPAPNNGYYIIDTIPHIVNSEIIIDTSLWYKVEGEFIATGNEQFLTIGNFTLDSISEWDCMFGNNCSGPGGAYYFIDSVWLSLKSQVPLIPEDTTTNPKPIDSTIVENPIDCINIYPNPSAGIFQIDCSEDITHIKVYDDIGRLVLQQFSNFQSLDLSFCRNATYLVVINTDATVYRKKVVVLK